MRNGATWPRENWPGVRRPEDPAVPLYQSLTMVPLTSFLFFQLCHAQHVGSQILVPLPGIEPEPPALEAWNPNHWTTLEVP